MAWINTVVVISVAAALGGGCGTSIATLQRLSSGQTGCKPDDVEVSDHTRRGGSQNWTAKCSGQTYSCSLTTVYYTSQVACSPMGGGMAAREESFDPVAAGYGGGSSDRRAQVERGFQASTNTRFVRGTFGLPGGMRALLVGAPQVAMGRIAVTLEGRTRLPELVACQSVDILVNAVPSTSEENAVATAGATLKVESRFDFQVFKPLASQFPEFGLRACGQNWKFAPNQVEELKKFLVIYSEMAQQVQAEAGKGGSPPADAAPAPTAL